MPTGSLVSVNIVQFPVESTLTNCGKCSILNVSEKMAAEFGCGRRDVILNNASKLLNYLLQDASARARKDGKKVPNSS